MNILHVITMKLHAPLEQCAHIDTKSGANGSGIIIEWYHRVLPVVLIHSVVEERCYVALTTVVESLCPT